MDARSWGILHPYDDVERCFRHTDPAGDEGRAVVGRLLCLQEPPAGELLYDLSFFSGGIGVLDHLAITRQFDPALWLSVASSLHGRTPEEAAADESWGGNLI